MIFLLLSIIFNTYVAVCFKFFQRYGISNLQAIVVNYFVCVLTGIAMLGSNPFTLQNIHAPYFYWAILNGFSYFTVFLLIAYCTLKSGITPTQIANKLSLVIPVIFAHFLFQDSISALKIIGIVVAIFAVYFASAKKDTSEFASKNLALPIILFLGSGLIDLQTKYVQRTYLTSTESQNSYLIICFGLAGTLGLLVLLVQLYRKKEFFTTRNAVAGILLGIPNYFSIYFLIQTLSCNFLHTSAIIPVNNIGIVLLSTTVSIFIFKEKLMRKNYLGLALALVAILLIIIGDAT